MTLSFDTMAAPATTAVPAGVSPPSVVLGVVSGRGDDQSFEVAAFLNAPQGTTRIVIGIDSDDFIQRPRRSDGRFRRLGGVR